jgi:hypothetical protein
MHKEISGRLFGGRFQEGVGVEREDREQPRPKCQRRERGEDGKEEGTGKEENE